METTNLPEPKPGITNLHLYTPGKGQIGVRKLSSNENLYGPSPKAIEAVKIASQELWRYPSVDHLELRSNIAQVHGLDNAKIICGTGSDEILALIGKAYAGTGDEIIMTEHGFEIYGIIGQGVGADVVSVREAERIVNVDEIINSLTPKTKIIYIANPGNPTGTMIGSSELRRLALAIPKHVVLVIDSAYAEFADGYDGGISVVDEFQNVIMTRTFSKLYGLGGLRIGWAYGHAHFINTLNKIRGPFNLSSVALAGASAAILDQDYAQKCQKKITQDREYLASCLRQLGILIDESFANFVLARFENAKAAEEMMASLLENGIAVRSVGHYGLPEALRITIGTHEDVERVIDIIRDQIGAK